MDHICVVFPLLPGKTEEARAFQRELDTERKAEYDRSERRIGITKEYWFIASVPSGDQLVVYMESADFNRALGMFSQSQEPFDVWFKHQLADGERGGSGQPPAGHAAARTGLQLRGLTSAAPFRGSAAPQSAASANASSAVNRSTMGSGCSVYGQPGRDRSGRLAAAAGTLLLAVPSDARARR